MKERAFLAKALGHAKALLMTAPAVREVMAAANTCTSSFPALLHCRGEVGSCEAPQTGGLFNVPRESSKGMSCSFLGNGVSPGKLRVGTCRESQDG